MLGVLLAKWSWILFTPHATVAAVTMERGSAAEAERLFGVAAPDISPAERPVLPNVHLAGVFATRAGQPGFAILKLGDKQQLGVSVGESVMSGTRLLEVHPDYVLLEHAGMQQRVNLEVKAAGAAGASVTRVR